MKRSFRFVFVILCCVFVNYDVAKVEAQYLHPKVVEKKVTIHSAVILPAKVEIVKESAKGQEMMVAESADISSSVMEAVGESLQKKKITVAPNPFEPAAMNESRKYTLADIQTRYDGLLPKLIKKSNDVKKARFTLGDEVMLLNVHKDADVLVFIRGQGRMFTKGKTVFSIVNDAKFSLLFKSVKVSLGVDVK